MDGGNHFSQDESEIHTSCGPANNATLNDLELALIKRSGKFAAVPQRMAHYTANRETALEALLTRQKGDAAHAAGQPSGPGAVWSEMGEICLRDCPGRAGRRMRPASFWRGPAVAKTVSGTPCNSSRRFGGVPGILQRAK